MIKIFVLFLLSLNCVAMNLENYTHEDVFSMIDRGQLKVDDIDSGWWNEPTTWISSRRRMRVNYGRGETPAMSLLKAGRQDLFDQIVEKVNPDVVTSRHWNILMFSALYADNPRTWTGIIDLLLRFPELLQQKTVDGDDVIELATLYLGPETCEQVLKKINAFIKVSNVRFDEANSSMSHILDRIEAGEIENDFIGSIDTLLSIRFAELPLKKQHWKLIVDSTRLPELFGSASHVHWAKWGNFNIREYLNISIEESDLSENLSSPTRKSSFFIKLYLKCLSADALQSYFEKHPDLFQDTRILSRFIRNLLLLGNSKSEQMRPLLKVAYANAFDKNCIIAKLFRILKITDEELYQEIYQTYSKRQWDRVESKEPDLCAECRQPFATCAGVRISCGHFLHIPCLSSKKICPQCEIPY